jgi:hypothetical protein
MISCIKKYGEILVNRRQDSIKNFLVVWKLYDRRKGKSCVSGGTTVKEQTKRENNIILDAL